MRALLSIPADDTKFQRVSVALLSVNGDREIFQEFS